MNYGGAVARTIFALSSGAPPAAIAIVRISGPDAGGALLALAGRIPEPRYAGLATLRDPADGTMLDRALLLWNPGPASATGEDLVELHLHGGRAVVAAVLRVLADRPGLRCAEAGEFTRRAFENGRVDLLEAEGLADLLAAETETQRRAALVGAQGHLSRRISAWRREMVDIAASIEAEIEFSEEDDTIANAGRDTAAQLARLRMDVQDTLDMPPAERLRDGVRIVIAGPPNAGKSTLFNALIGRDAAIVSPHPGTTRDVIEAPLDLAGVPVLLCDTAGVRERGDPVEMLGIQRAREHMETADLLLWLGAAEEAPAHASRLIVAAKSDLDDATASADIAVSARTGAGVARLRSVVVERASQEYRQDVSILNARQRSIASEIRERLDGASRSSDPLVVAFELGDAIALVDRLTGDGHVEDMLAAVFSRFCIGK